MKHTPGPWKTHHNIGRKGEVGIVADEAPCIIAIMGNQKDWPKEAQANAEFIATACNSHYDLLEALEELVAQEDWEGEEVNPMSPVGKAFAVIARAREKTVKEIRERIKE